MFLMRSVGADVGLSVPEWGRRRNGFFEIPPLTNAIIHESDKTRGDNDTTKVSFWLLMMNINIWSWQDLLC
jgi:hypothetical protein